MKKILRAVLPALLALVLVCSFSPAASAETWEEVESVTVGSSAEYYTVSAPEEYTLLVSGHAVGGVKALMINLSDGTACIRAFVFPDQNGDFSVSINTAEGNNDYPVATCGQAVADELGGANGDHRCYSTMPGYKSVGQIPDGYYRVVIYSAVTDAEVDGIYDGSWYQQGSNLAGYTGNWGAEAVVKMTGNSPAVIRYPNVESHNAAVRAKDASLTPGSAAWARYTDVYLKDLEGSMHMANANFPMLDYKVDYIKQVADEITAGAGSDAEKAMRIFNYVSDGLYYDFQGHNTDTAHIYCNPYDILRALREGISSQYSINGKVGSVCNGYTATMVALARAEGIPARAVCGARLAAGTGTWDTTGVSYTTQITHFWTEFYLNGSWVAADGVRGGSKSWRRSDFSVADDGTWQSGGTLYYMGFGMNEPMLGSTYYYNCVYDSWYYSEEVAAPEVVIDKELGYVRLSWEPVDGAEGYWIYRGDSESSCPYFAAAKSGNSYYIVEFDETAEALARELDTPYYYRVRAIKRDASNAAYGSFSNMLCATLTSADHEHTAAPVIKQDPADVQTTVGENAVFSVTAEGEGLSYQWQFRSSPTGTWSSTSAEGNKTATLTVPATLARSGYQYRCKVSTEFFTRFSESATLTVTESLPEITVQPVAVPVEINATATFSLTASGVGELSYQWQYFSADNNAWYSVTDKEGDIAGAKTDTLSIVAKQFRGGYRYRCRVRNASGDVFSDEVVLSFIPAPTVVTQPRGVSAGIGETAVFRVTASGEGTIAYQWQYYSVNNDAWYSVTDAEDSYSGAKTASLSVVAKSFRNGYRYRCKISNGGGSTISDEATLTVSEITKPKVSAPSSVSLNAGGTATFTVTAAGGGEMSYQWQYRSSASASWASATAEGNKTPTLKVPATTARNGYQYRCKVTNSAGTTWSAVATLTVYGKPVFRTQPSDAALNAGGTATFTVTAEGSGELSYQWQYRSSPSGSWYKASAEGNKTPTLKLPATTARNGYQYRCKVTNEVGSSWSAAATLTVYGKPVFTAQPGDLTLNAGDTAVFSVTASGSGELSYQWIYRSSPSGSWYNASAEGNKTPTLRVPATAGRSGYQYRCKVTNEVGSSWSAIATLTVYAPAKPTITVQPQSVTIEKGGTAAFTVEAEGSGELSYRWQYYSTSKSAWYLIPTTTNGYEGVETPTLYVSAAGHNGMQYRCRVSNAAGSSFSESATLTVYAPAKPTITLQPESVTAQKGSTAIFTVAASGDGELSYQWQYRTSSTGSWISASAEGNKTATLYVPATSGRSGYQYRCKVTNEVGSSWSAAATLTVE